MLSEEEKKAAMRATYYGPMWHALGDQSLVDERISKEDKLNFG